MLKRWDELCAVVRGLRRAPVFFFGTVLALTIGVGSNGAIFSLIHAVLLQPLPNFRAEEIVRVWPWRPAADETVRFIRTSFSSDRLLDLREATRDVLTDFAAIHSWEGNPEAWFDLGLADHTERLRGAYVTPNFFRAVGIKAAIGRTFDEGDERSGQSLIVLSHGLWQRSFGGDPSLVGRTISMTAGRFPREPRTFTVLGVLPRDFRFTYPLETEAWVLYPWAAVRGYPRGAVGFTAVARLKPGVSFAAAQARAASLHEGSGPAADQELRRIARLERLEDWMVANTRPSLLLLGGVAGLLLLLTCATVAGLLFVRVTKRQRELAIRSALGAHRLRLMRELLLEGVLLAVAGSVGGMIAAVSLFPALRAVVPAIMPRADSLGLSLSFAGFGVAVTALVVLLASVAPALRGSRADQVVTLKSAGIGASADRSTVRWRQGLIGFQSAVATSLLVFATLLLVSFWRLQRVPLGFDGERVMTVELRLLDTKYRQPGALAAFQEDLATRVRAIPGVLELGIATAAPFRGVDFLSVLNQPGRAVEVEVNTRSVDPGYFSVLRIGVKRGRGLRATDTPDRPRVTVISESLARTMFSGDDPLGRTIDYGGPHEVVGVVGDLRYQSRDKAPRAAMYLPLSQRPSELMCILVRLAPNAGDVAAAIRRTVHEIDPGVPAMNAATLDQIVSDSVADRRFYSVAASAFAAVALLLTSVGLGVLVARVVAERRRELAIRAALGAAATRLLRLAVGQGVFPVTVGAVVGLGGAFAGAGLVQHLLFEITPRAPWAYAAVGGLVLLVAVGACLIAARDVFSADPATVLRAE